MTPTVTCFDRKAREATYSTEAQVCYGIGQGCSGLIKRLMSSVMVVALMQGYVNV